MAYTLPFLGNAEKKAQKLRGRYDAQTDPMFAVDRQPLIPSAPPPPPMTMAERIKEFESQGPYGGRSTIVPATPPARSTGVPTPTPRPVETPSMTYPSMPFEDFTAQRGVTDWSEEMLLGIFKSGIVEPPPVISGPTGGVTEVGPREDKLVPYPVTSRTGQQTTQLLPESIVKELDERVCLNP